VPVILALDTSTPRISVAISRGGSVHGVWFDVGRRTGAVLSVAVADLLAGQGVGPQDLTGVAVGVGPGPYTSLRVGVTFATTVAHALGLQVVGACSHDVIARQVIGVGLGSDGPGGVGQEATAFCVATDARRREVYLARYCGDGTRLHGPIVMTAEAARQRWPQDRWVSVPHVAPGALQPTGRSDQTVESARRADQAAELASAASPDARALAEWAESAWPESSAELADVPQHWDGAASDGADAGFVPQTLLVPQPLYLRRPDATEPVRS
jgi:tRNA threonylcarbamoyl adenosine modification protein YeaZ